MTEQLDAWERREGLAYRVIPYIMLAASTVFAIAFMSEDWRLTLLLAGITAAWLLATQRHGPRQVHYVGLLILIAVLIVHNPLFGFFGISGYLAADAFPGRWMYVGVVWTAFWTGTSQVGGLPLPDTTPVSAWLGVVAVNVIVASLLMRYGTAIEARNRQLKEALAENAALAREAGIQEERRRMAGEIHDTLAQGLTGIVAQLEALEHAQRRGGDWRRHLDTATQLARESLSEARRSVRAVGPQALDDARLPDAIADVARRWSGINGIEAEVVTTGTARPMHPDVEVTLLRAAQEALANVGRHAQASRVGVTLSYMGDVVTLDVRDDGVGFTPNGSAGFGLTAMRERVERLEGRLDVESEPGAGTAVSASVPGAGGGVISLLIVDDHPVVRDGLRALLHGRRRVRGDRRGGRRPACGGDGRGAPARRRADGPADARRRRGDRDPRALRADPRGPRARSHHLRHRQRRAAGDRGRRHRLPAQGCPRATSSSAPSAPRRRASPCSRRRSPRA